MKKINVETIKKAIIMVYAVYCICYLVASAITLLILYKDQITNIFRRVGLKMTCFFKQVEDRIHPTKVDTGLNEAMKSAMRGAPVIHMDDLEFACSEE